jgi:hypothetical protein
MHVAAHNLHAIDVPVGSTADAHIIEARAHAAKALDVAGSGVRWEDAYG